jgi:AcrR family transcriptional regulator
MTVPAIVEAAVAVADQEGLEGLSMRRVADRLGVGTMSLYRYVPGKAELLDLMLDAVSAETARPVHQPGAWRDGLAQVARENLSLYRRHPWLLGVSTGRPPLGPNVIAKYDYELRAVEGVGLTDVEMDSVLTLVLGYIHGAAARAADAAAESSRTGISDQDWWDAYAPLLADVLDAQRYPLAARVGSAAGEEYGDPNGYGPAVEFGLQRVLDGIAALIAGRRR